MACGIRSEYSGYYIKEFAVLLCGLDVTFTAKVQAIGRVAIPLDIRDRLGIHKGDMITVRIEKGLPRRQRT